MKKFFKNVNVRVAVISATAVIITGILGAAVTIATARIQDVPNNSQTSTIIYNVNAPTSIPQPTSKPTLASTPQPTSKPISASTPQPTSKSIPAPESIVTINLPSDNAAVEGTFTISGEYSNLKEGEDDIWVFIFPESANGLAWPQTDDLNAQKSAVKDNGKWHVTCSVGGRAQESHRIYVYTGTKSASDSVRKVMKEWLNSKPFCTWGIKIPLGLVEKASITVTKQGE